MGLHPLDLSITFGWKKQPQWSSGSQAIVNLSSWDDVILKASCSVLYVYRQAYYSVSVMENEQML